MVRVAPLLSMLESRSLATLEIDALQFAREGRSVSGEVRVESLPRLSEQLGQASSVQLQCSLSGRRGEAGKAWLRIQVSGEVVLACQRCLGEMPHAVHVDSEVQVIPEGDPWPDEVLEDGGLSPVEDAIPAEASLSVASLIEDEVLLALPLAPRHEENNPACVPLAHAQDKLAASPFAVLAGLKKH